MKLEIPKFRYLTQDLNGWVSFHLKKPFTTDNFNWSSIDRHESVRGNKNPNWESTRIDLEVDDYEFEDGILRRIEK